MLRHNRVFRGYVHITLKIDGPEEKTIHYEYKCREEGVKGATEVSAVIPEIETRVSMTASNADAEGYVKEGYAFSPMFTLGYRKQSQIRRYLQHGSTWQRQIKL